VLLADRLGLPHATLIMQIGVEGDHLRVKRELEAGCSNGRASASRCFDDSVRHHKVGTRRSKGSCPRRKEITTISRGSLGVTHEPTQRIERIYVPDQDQKTEFLTGTPKEAAAKLLEN